MSYRWSPAGIALAALLQTNTAFAWVAGIDMGWTDQDHGSLNGNHLVGGLSADFKVSPRLGVRGQVGFASPGDSHDDASARSDVRFLTGSLLFSSTDFWKEMKGLYALVGCGVYNRYESTLFGGWSNSDTAPGVVAGVGGQWYGWEPALIRLEGLYHFDYRGQGDFYTLTLGIHLAF